MKPFRKKIVKPANIRSSIATPQQMSNCDSSQHRNHSVDALLRRCAKLAKKKDILTEFETAIDKLGLVGEARNAKLILLAMITRVFDRPVSVVVKGSRSGGKNTLVATVMKFFPHSAYSTLTGMSDKALAYFSKPLKHRVLIVTEASGLKEGGDYFLRSLLSEGYLRYEVTVGKGTRTVEVEGPTGLILTTTNIRLYEDDESRLFSIDIADSRRQTRKVLKAIGESFVNPKTAKDAKVAAAWPALLGAISVAPPLIAVPFAGSIMELMADNDTRLRRDAKAMLALVQAHALLHRENRVIASDGTLTATMTDYKVVRGLVDRIMARGVELAVTPAVRKTVRAVRSLDVDGKGVSTRQLIDKLELDKSGVSRHTQTAIEAGYLRNQNEGTKKYASYIVGDPMPSDKAVLPTAKEVAEHQKRSAARTRRKAKAN